MSYFFFNILCDGYETVFEGLFVVVSIWKRCSLLIGIVQIINSNYEYQQMRINAMQCNVQF